MLPTFAEVVLAMHEANSDDYISIHRGTRVRKCHTSRRDAFQTIGTRPLGRVDLKSLQVQLFTDDFQKRDVRKDPQVLAGFDETVTLLKFHPSFNPEIIDWLREKKCHGIVLEGTGLGHVGRACFSSIRKAVDSGILIAMASQCVWGMVDMNVYETGRDLLAMGVIPLGDMITETAYVKMMWVLGQTKDMAKAREMMTTPMAYEFAERRVL